MDGKTKHPFNIQCRYCNSNAVVVIAYEYRDLGIKCKSCGTFISTSEYHTDKYNYFDCFIDGTAYDRGFKNGTEVS